jgi:hypothetical protein
MFTCSTKASVYSLLTLLLLTAVAAVNPLRDKVANWLDSPDPSRTHNRLLEEHHEGTGEWFLESEEFDRWMETPAATLWIKGMRTCPTLYCQTDSSLILSLV